MASLLSSALVFSLCVFYGASAGTLQSYTFYTMDGVLHFSHRNSTAQSLLNCLMSTCSRLERCVASFNKKTGACMTATLSTIPQRSWKKDFLFNNDIDKNWVSSFLLRDPALAPAGMWTMDSFFRGRNLGYKGKVLDSSETGLTWSSEGPRGPLTPFKYALFTGKERPQIQVIRNSIFHIDFTKPFTVALWVKTDAREAIQPLLQGWNTVNDTTAFQFWFYNSKNLDQIFLNANNRIYTELNGTNKLLWRHIAVTYDGKDQYSAYLNGTNWPISIQKGSLTRVNPDVIQIGFLINSNNVFKGSMACIAIFQRNLTTNEVRAFMLTCP